MDSTITRRLGRGTAATLAAAALTLAGVAFAAPANAAENDVVADSGDLDWGYKESFRNYVSSGGQISVADGAERNGTAANAGFLFPVAGGHVVDADTVTIDTAGKAQFTYTAHFFDVALSNISIVVDGAEASIVADTYVKADIAFGSFPQGTFNETDVVLADIGSPVVTIDGDQVTVTGTNVVVTEEGAGANPLYAAGTVLDDFSVTATIEGAGETPVEPAGEDEITVTVPETTTPTEPSGAFSWAWGSGDAASLGTAVEQDDSFVATGALNTIVVTDTRAGGSEPYDWSISASVSDFTSGAGSFGAENLSWTPSVTSASSAVTPGAAASDLSSSTVLASSTAAASAEVDAELSLSVPNDTPAGDYAATVTVTALS
ncbi:HtaA domain-containing protein [Microbacterium gilvum]|uniref:Htaa domain-containing protein n=1 Tax=Microbacterium gilvum TaxID=1336204 RepID=A0ABP9A0A9_9MICO